MDRAEFIKTEVPKLVAATTTDCQPLWGLMSAQHMIEHLEMTFYISTDKITLPLPKGITAEEFQQKQRAIFSPKWVFPRNVRVKGVPAKPKPLKYDSMDIAKQRLMKSHAYFYEYHANNPKATANHPVFGALTFDGWLAFHTKHCVHHFTQLGVFEATK